MLDSFTHTNISTRFLYFSSVLAFSAVAHNVTPAALSDLCFVNISRYAASNLLYNMCVFVCTAGVLQA